MNINFFSNYLKHFAFHCVYRCESVNLDGKGRYFFKGYRPFTLDQDFQDWTKISGLKDLQDFN